MHYTVNNAFFIHLHNPGGTKVHLRSKYLVQRLNLRLFLFAIFRIQIANRACCYY